MTVNGIEITEYTVLATRQHFIDIYRRCIADVLSGETKVNDIDDCIKWREKHIIDMEQGKSDHTLTFLQCALWLQTGECIALLS